MIKYEIALASPHTHTVLVKQTLPAQKQPALLKMAAWVPGSYTMRDFSKHIVSIKAFSERVPNALLHVEKVDDHTYQVEAIDDDLVVVYEVYCWDRSVRGSHFDLTHGFFNFSSLCLFSPTLKDEPIEVTLTAPPATYQALAWEVATTLPTVKVDSQGFGIYKADNFEMLIDHPVEMGQLERYHFESNGVKHQLAITGSHDGDGNRLQADVAKICDYHNQLFGQTPFAQYLFLLTLSEHGYGGLEHKDSTALMCFKKTMPLASQGEHKDYAQLLGLFSHEYFHAWNVKRIKPLEFYNLDLTKPHHTKQLWAFEGITSYYDDMALVRSGCIEPEAYLELIGQTITRVYQTKGHLKQTVRESSFDAWTKFYHPNENSPNSLVSYYAKGSLCALLFDLHLRQHTQSSLDDVMRTLWQRYGSQDVGVKDGDIEQIMTELCPGIKPLIDLCLNTTEPLPLATYLETFGVALSWDYPEDAKTFTNDSPVSLGCRLDTHATLTHVLDGGSTQLAGLCAGDTLVAMDDDKITMANLPTRLSRKKAGDIVKMHVFREERLLSFDVELQASEKNQAKLSLMDVGEQTLALRQAWLGQNAT